MELKTNKLAHIRYTRTTDIGGCKAEVTDRVIIPTYVPHDSVKAVDVSDLTEAQVKDIQDAMSEYTQYVEERMATIFSFEDWADHVGKSVDLKRRTFKLSTLEVIKAE